MSRIATVEEAHDLLAGMNLGFIREFLVNREGYSMEQAEKMEDEYKRFMAICAVHATRENPLPISGAVDPFWHAHILHTYSYAEMSGLLGSKYFHHVPASGDDLIALEPGYNKTLEIYNENFGIPSKEFWPEFGQICGGSGCSCSGTGNE
jgi:hypothetical protein